MYALFSALAYRESNLTVATSDLVNRSSKKVDLTGGKSMFSYVAGEACLLCQRRVLRPRRTWNIPTESRITLIALPARISALIASCRERDPSDVP